MRAIRTRMHAHVLTTSKGHYAAAAYKAKSDDSGLGYTAYRYIGGLNLRDLRTQLASDKIIAHVNSCIRLYGPPKSGRANALPAPPSPPALHCRCRTGAVMPISRINGSEPPNRQNVLCVCECNTLLASRSEPT